MFPHRHAFRKHRAGAHQGAHGARQLSA
jgi:hypothetical protein